MDTFDKMVDSFKDFADLRAFSESQNRIILDLQKKVKDLENEKILLVSQSESKSPGIDAQVKHLVLNENNQIELAGIGISPARILCEIEIARLQEITMKTPLTFEEVKKLDILVKNLLLLKEEEKKTKKNDISRMPTGDLLKLVESGE